MESYYRDQAASCAAQADAATLPNVEARLRRSEAVWTAMADRAARHAEIKTTGRP
ncbi:hypothetical protein [Sphingomonas sp. MA1305]|uniref:hypothetical protein n=1 Tax=Sphingomonas sp. MA1305 TaxID=2479204 RepID=UPI0018E042D2|nr:hypothetical protein [Sphingomonas sp. MA1305]